MSILQDEFNILNNNIERKNTNEETVDLNIADIKIFNGKIKNKQKIQVIDEREEKRKKVLSIKKELNHKYSKKFKTSK